MGKGLGVLQGVHYTWKGEGSTTVVRTTYNWIALGSTCKALSRLFCKNKGFFWGAIFFKSLPKKEKRGALNDKKRVAPLEMEKTRRGWQNERKARTHV
jgi:uncharacterized membrane protein YobD (UPF0266 family)